MAISNVPVILDASGPALRWRIKDKYILLYQRWHLDNFFGLSKILVNMKLIFPGSGFYLLNLSENNDWRFKYRVNYN